VHVGDGRTVAIRKTIDRVDENNNRSLRRGVVAGWVVVVYVIRAVFAIASADFGTRGLFVGFARKRVSGGNVKNNGHVVLFSGTAAILRAR